MPTKEELQSHLAKYDQEHVLAFWDEIDESGRRHLAEQLAEIDLDELAELYRRRNEEAGGKWAELAARAKTPPAFRLGRENAISAEDAERAGREALSAGKVGVILVAGGQGTRLGFDEPKGMFPIGPVSQRTLFQMHIDALRAVAARHGVSIPLYVMTSLATDERTREYLNENDRFGLPEQDLVIFQQGSMPAVDAETGKLLLAEKDALFESPDGHGGMLKALAKSGCLEDARQRGVTQLFYLQIDNPLVRTCDPRFLGYHLLSESEMSTQVVAKQDPAEKVGVVVEIDGRVQIIEYSDLPDEQAARRDKDGGLALWAGNIAVHAFDVGFLVRMSQQAGSLPFHLAYKAVPHIDSEGNHVEPEEPNGIKFEKFIFDLLPHAKNAIVEEVDKQTTFAPVKNADGAAADTPSLARQALVNLHADWLRQAGAEVQEGVAVEINPLFALDPQELAEKIEPGLTVTEPTHFA